MLKMHIIHLVEYTLMGTFAAGMVIWIYHAMITGDSAIEWNHAFAVGAIFGFFSLTGTGTTITQITRTE